LETPASAKQARVLHEFQMRNIKNLKSWLSPKTLVLITRFRIRASRGSTEKALEVLDKLKQDFEDQE
jgi:hypothetical protein